MVKKLSRSPLGNFGSNVLRFQNISKEDFPGPGSYQSEKIMDEYFDTSLNISPVFKSKSIRDALWAKKGKMDNLKSRNGPPTLRLRYRTFHDLESNSGGESGRS
jgi:hypothetical protein